MAKKNQIIRPHAEDVFGKEIDAIKAIDDKPKPTNWQLSPWGVVQYIIGGKLKNGTSITTKYFGKKRLVEIAVGSLATDRALLLLGIPGTGKTWLSEHLAAAISGDSTLIIQGTAGLTEDALRYSWNYAHLLSKGPSAEAIVPSPVMTGMDKGGIVRIEELTRLAPEVQDALIMVLSEKTLPIPELGSEIQAKKGFNLIATANDRDKGVNELSSALKRRFNTVVLPLPKTVSEEVAIVVDRVKSLGTAMDLPKIPSPTAEIKRLVTIFQELRNGKTIDGTTKLKSPSSTLSTAEAISVIHNGQVLATHFGNGKLQANDLASSLVGAIIKDPKNDKIVWAEYLETIMSQRKDWNDLYEACKELE